VVDECIVLVAIVSIYVEVDAKVEMEEDAMGCRVIKK
jgi:hypothetical protein